MCNAKVKCKAVRETRKIETERESEWERARSVMSFYSSKKNEIIADERERESEAGRRRQRERGQRSPEQATATSAKE